MSGNFSGDEGGSLVDFVAEVARSELRVEENLGEGYVRLSYSYSIKHLTRAMELIKEFLKELQDESNS